MHHVKRPTTRKLIAHGGQARLRLSGPRGPSAPPSCSTRDPRESRRRRTWAGCSAGPPIHRFGSATLTRSSRSSADRGASRFSLRATVDCICTTRHRPGGKRTGSFSSDPVSLVPCRSNGRTQATSGIHGASRAAPARAAAALLPPPDPRRATSSARRRCSRSSPGSSSCPSEPCSAASGYPVRATYTAVGSSPAFETNASAQPCGVLRGLGSFLGRCQPRR